MADGCDSALKPSHHVPALCALTSGSLGIWISLLKYTISLALLKKVFRLQDKGQGVTLLIISRPHVSHVSLIFYVVFFPWMLCVGSSGKPGHCAKRYARPPAEQTPLAVFNPTLNWHECISHRNWNSTKGGRGWKAVICIGWKSCDDWVRQDYVAHFFW